MAQEKKVTCISCGKYKVHFERGCCQGCFKRRAQAKGPHGVPTPCDHCIVGQGWTKRRRLCDDCWKDEAVREFYGGKDGLVESDRLKEVSPPQTPCTAEPGSDEKIKVLSERYANGESLHHPQDKKVPYSPAGFGMFIGKDRVI